MELLEAAEGCGARAPLRAFQGQASYNAAQVITPNPAPLHDAEDRWGASGYHQRDPECTAFLQTSLFHATYPPRVAQAQRAAAAALTLSIRTNPATAQPLTAAPGLQVTSSWISAFLFLTAIFNVS